MDLPDDRLGTSNTPGDSESDPRIGKNAYRQLIDEQTPRRLSFRSNARGLAVRSKMPFAEMGRSRFRDRTRGRVFFLAAESIAVLSHASACFVRPVTTPPVGESKPPARKIGIEVRNPFSASQSIGLQNRVIIRLVVPPPLSSHEPKQCRTRARFASVNANPTRSMKIITMPERTTCCHRSGHTPCENRHENRTLVGLTPTIKYKT